MLKPAISFRQDIQGMRAIAVAIVVLAHAGVPGFSGGFVGVDVFFVISGYLITGLLVSERLDTGRVLYGRFLARRLLRLLPALVVMLVIVQLVSRSLLSSYEALMQTGSLVYAATWTSNLYFNLAEFNYFATLQAKDLYLHTWSLGVEEQFYLVWPWLVMLAFTLTGRNASREHYLRSLSVLFLALFFGSLTLSLYWVEHNQLMSFYMMPSRGWQFALGAGAALASFRPPQVAQGVKNVGLLLAMLMIICSTLFLHAKLAYPGYYALIPSVGAALLLFGGVDGRASPVNRILSSKALVWLGDRSYSVYLWHWPVLTLGGSYGLGASILGVMAMLMITVLLATVSYKLVEKPFWKGRYSHGAPRAVTLSSALAVLLLVGLAHTMVADVITKIPAPLYDYSGDMRTEGRAAFSGALDCDRWHFSADVVPCSVGDPEAAHTAVLIGDSLGANWASFLPKIYTSPGWRIMLFTKSACAIVDVEYFYQPAGGLYDVCTEWREDSLELIASLEPDIVFISNSSYYEFSEPQWTEGTRSVLEKISSATDHVVLIPGTPKISFNGSSCIREPYRFTLRLVDSERMCEEKQASTTSDDVAGYLKRAARDFPNAQVLNLNDLVCPGHRCAARNLEGITVFSDELHLTGSFVLSKVPRIREELKAMGVGPNFVPESGVRPSQL